MCLFNLLPWEILLPAFLPPFTAVDYTRLAVVYLRRVAAEYSVVDPLWSGLYVPEMLIGMSPLQTSSNIFMC